MATDLELLQQARTALLTSMAANAGKPDYTIEGQSVSWSEIFRRLAIIDSQIAAGEPFEFVTQATT